MMRPRRLAHTALVALLMVLVPVLGGLVWWSWWRTTTLVEAQAMASLRFQVQLATSRWDDAVRDVQQATERLARSPVVVNAVTDGTGPSLALLEGVLVAQTVVEGGTVRVYRFDAQPLGTSVVAYPEEQALVRQALKTGHSERVVSADQVLFAVPVFYALTGQHEGVVLQRMPMAPLVRRCQESLEAHLSVTGREGWHLGHLPAEDDLTITAPLTQDDAALRLTVARDGAVLRAPAQVLLREHMVMAGVVLVLAVGLALVVMRQLTCRLEVLAAASRTADAAAIPDVGADEVGDVAQALRAALTAAAHTRHDLEAQVAMRTAQLTDALKMGKMGAWVYEVAEDRFSFNDELYAVFHTTAAAEGGYTMSAATFTQRFIPPSHQGLVAAEVGRLLQDPTAPGLVMDHPFCCPDGTLGQVEVRNRAIRDAAGRVERIIGVNHDITERKRLEDTLASKCEEAEAANRAKSAFLATMSHEIRTPLNGIIGMASILETGELTAEQQDQVATITASGRHLLALLNDILDFSKIEAGHLRLEDVPFDPRRLASEVVGMLASTAAAKGLALPWQVSEAVPAHLQGDPARLRQILVNVLGNAVKFTEHGEVRMTVAWVADDASAHLVITVQDSGIGIPEERLAQLFQPFVQADDSITRRFGGTGLGLAICRRLSEAMGGSITVASTLGVGTTFTVTLPGRVAATASVTPGVVPAAAPLRQGRILLVEDNAVNQRVAGLMLKHLGHEVLVVADGQQAVDFLARERVDLVLMDCQMPVLDGWAATRRVRASDSTALQPQVPIVALTANALAGDRAECLAAGMDDMLAKPIDLDALRAMLARWLWRQPRV